MKRFLTALVAVILTIVMGVMLLACDPSSGNQGGTNGGGNGGSQGGSGGAADAEIDLLGGFDLTKGITAAFDADVKIKVYGYDSDKDKQTSEIESMKIGGTAKAKIENETFNADLELKMEGSDPEMEMPAIANAYIRGDEVYSGIAYDKDGEVVYQNESMSDANFNEMIATLLPEAIETVANSPLYRLATNYIEFKKVGDTYKAEIDGIEIAGKLLDKVGEIIKDVTIETTVGDLYNALGVKEILEVAYGDMTAQEMWDETLAQLELIKSVDPDADVPELPETFDAMIEMLNEELEEELEYTLPAAGDKTIVEYLDSVIDDFKDITVGDIALIIINEGEEIPEEYLEEAMESISASLEMIKTMAPAAIAAVKGELTLSTAKITLVADKDGHLSSVAVDVALDESLMTIMDKIGGSDEAEKGGDIAQQPSTVAAITNKAEPFFAVKAELTIAYSASNFVDVTTLKTEADKMKEVAGTYKLVKISVREYDFEEDNYVIVEEYELGDDFNGTILTADVAVLTLNEDGTGTIVVSFGGDDYNGTVSWDLYDINVNFGEGAPFWFDGEFSENYDVEAYGSIYQFAVIVELALAE